MPLRILIAPDSFKGSLSAVKVAKAIETGWRTVRPADEIFLAPQADGGEGTLDVIESTVIGAVRHKIGLVTGPDGRPTPGEWLELPGRIGIVELAQSSGLPLMKSLDALKATSRGLGEVISAVLDSGIESLLIGVGGSASTDGGAGALSALGLELYDAQGRTPPDGGEGLLQIATIDRRNVRSAPNGGVTVLTDVRSPLLGPNGAATIFGPQKGATPSQIATLDLALTHFSGLLGGNAKMPGSGAAGGTAYAFATIWNAKIESGADYISNLSNLPQLLQESDLLITGEGSFDQQSLSGKVVGQLLNKAKESNIRSAVIAGQIKVDSEVWQSSLTEMAGSVAAALENPAHWLALVGAKAARDLSLKQS